MMKCLLNYQSNAVDGKIYAELSPSLLGNPVTGNPIVLNGSQLSINNRVFRCGMFHHGPRALTKTKDSPDIISYWCSSLDHDRRTNRENGKNLHKRIKTVNQRGYSCKFQFTLKWVVDVCVYLELRQKSGCPFHNSHPKFIDPQTVPIPTRLLTLDQIDNIVHVVNAYI